MSKRPENGRVEFGEQEGAGRVLMTCGEISLRHLDGLVLAGQMAEEIDCRDDGRRD